MPTLRVLLIEDSTSDQVLFVNQVQNDAGDVSVDCASSLSEAFSYLETAEYDQVWLDPGLPDLKPSSIGQVLATLKKHVEPGEVRMLSSTASPEVRRQASQQQVSLLHKDALMAKDSESEILAIVREMIVKRSGGATQRVELGKHEMRLLHVEGALDEIKSTLKDLGQRSGRLEELDLQIKLMTGTLNQLPALQAAISKLEHLTDKDLQLSTNQTEVRKFFLQFGLPALIAGGVTVATLLLPHYFPDVKPGASPAPSASPTVPAPPPSPTHPR